MWAACSTCSELKIDQNTLVMIAGDNGSSFDRSPEVGSLFNQASNGLRGYKRGLYERCASVRPLSPGGPASAAGRVKAKNRGV